MLTQAGTLKDAFNNTHSEMLSVADRDRHATGRSESFESVKVRVAPSLRVRLTAVGVPLLV